MNLHVPCEAVSRPDSPEADIPGRDIPHTTSTGANVPSTLSRSERCAKAAFCHVRHESPNPLEVATDTWKGIMPFYRSHKRSDLKVCVREGCWVTYCWSMQAQSKVSEIGKQSTVPTSAKKLKPKAKMEPSSQWVPFVIWLRGSQYDVCECLV